MPKKLRLKLKVVPTSGPIMDTTHSIEAEPTGALLRDVLKSAGIKPDKMRIEVNGKQADLDSYVTDDAAITVTEKPSGS